MTIPLKMDNHIVKIQEEGMGNNVLMLKHIAIEGGGTIEEYLLSKGYKIDRRELQDGDSVPSKLDYDIILILGGPMNE